MSALGGGANDLAEPASAAGAGARDASFALRFGWLAVMGAVFSTYGFANSPRAARRCRPSRSAGSTRSRSCRGRSCRTGRSTCCMRCRSFLDAPRRPARSREAAVDRAADLGRVLHRVAAALRVRAARRGRRGRCAVHAADGLRQAVQPGAVAAHRVARRARAVYAKHLRGTLARGVLHLWFAAIGVSVLTTYQHHAIDVPTGAAVGCLALFLFPLRDAAGRLPGADASPGAAGRALARRYALGVAALALVGGAARARLGAGGRVGRAGARLCRVDLPARRARRVPEERARAVPGRHALAVRADDRRRIRQFAAMDVPAAGASADRRARVDRAHADDTRRAPPRLHGAGRPDR